MKKIKVLETESAEIVASIDDLVIEFLLRLPVKSLIRFEIVSKRWHSLITSPEFRRRFNSKHNSAVGLLLPQYNHRGYSLFEYVPFFPKNSTVKPMRKLEFMGDDSCIRILHSCNGLLLCSGFVESSTKYYVYNPTTNQSSILPKLDGNICGMSLAFDPAKSPRYKVVCVRRDPQLYDRFQVVIYSSETGAWRISSEPFTARVNFKNGVYWNGAVHWIGYPSEDVYSLYFDIHQHVLEKMPNPPMQIHSNETKKDYYFGESCDHLHYFEIPQLHFNVYEMKRDYSEWFVKYHVDLSPVVVGMDFEPLDLDYRDFAIFAIVRGEEEKSSFIVWHIFGKAIRCNIVLKTFEKLHEFEVVEDLEVEDSLVFRHPRGFQYIESLC